MSTTFVASYSRSQIKFQNLNKILCTPLTRIISSISIFPPKSQNFILPKISISHNNNNNHHHHQTLPKVRKFHPLWFSVMSQNNDHGLTNLQQDSTKSVRCVIKGRVQGVFYRNGTIENATQLGLKGWVRNRRDGSVEALFSGKTEVVDEMMQRCRRGPPDAMVTAFQPYPCNDDPGTGFERRPTV